jgi:UDP-N-acetylmuramate: L-alanyl-gamma-D-glutamyl-meso-diaminopimelate ligase
MELAPGARVHLIAACGTAMGALAGMLRERGYRVSGSDTHVYPPMSTFLSQIGVCVQEGFSADRLEPPPDLVVIGNAVSRGNPEVEATLAGRLPYASLPEVLREHFLRDRLPVVITGTHGKTTTTAMAAYLLSQCGQDPSFLVAGIPVDFPRPYHLGDGKAFVIEGDEYDTAFFAKHAKFLYYLPHTVVINNIEFDHADIYADLAEIERSFRQLVNIIPANGLLLANAEDPTVTGLLAAAPCRIETFGLREEADWGAERLVAAPDGMTFQLRHAGACLGPCRLAQHGLHNVRNALAALAIAIHGGAAPEAALAALQGYGGVCRRQERIGTVAGIELIDDFAHHPTAVAATLAAVRLARPAGALWVLFEPASSTNARALFEDRYAEAFGTVDHCLIGRVPRPERARRDPPFSPERLAARICALGGDARYLPRPADMVTTVAEQAVPGDTVVFMSNGGFGGVQALLLAALRQRYATPA